MKRTLALLAIAVIALAPPALAQVSDGVCNFNWMPHYEQLTRYVSGPGTSSSDAKTFVLRVESPPVAGLRETWYVARSAQGSETAAFHRLFGNNEHMDSAFTGETGYAFQRSLDFPWTSAAKAGRTPAGTTAHGMTPLARYVRSSPLDRQTWLNTQTPSGYTREVTYDGTTALGPERLGYQRFGNLLTKDDVLGVNGSGPAYGTHFLDNGVLRVDFNKIWGNAIGRITQAGTGRQIVLEPIGDMVQTVVRFPEDTGDPDCRNPNPTQSGSVGPGLVNTHLWTGSPVLSSAKTTDAVTAVQTFRSVVRPFEFVNAGGSATSRWPGTDDTSPLAWKGFIERTDNLGCRFGGLTRRDIMKTTSRLILAPNNPLAQQAVYAVNTHWLRPADLANAPAPGTPVNWNFTVQCHNFRTGLRKTLLAGKDLTTCTGGPECTDTTCGDPDEVNGKAPDDHAIIVMRQDKTFGFAVARFNLAVHESTPVIFRCGNPPCTSQESGGIIIQAARGRHAEPRSLITRTAWGTPLESFLIVNNESAINIRLNELYADNKSCTD
ncbi:MAG TPA: hypothetical protein VHK90_13795 [Thermoanaerobaculia bacterium]|nr:hypothetical protein [Thermoanaerobaculia bacterium]